MYVCRTLIRFKGSLIYFFQEFLFFSLSLSFFLTTVQRYEVGSTYYMSTSKNMQYIKATKSIYFFFVHIIPRRSNNNNNKNCINFRHKSLSISIHIAQMKKIFSSSTFSRLYRPYYHTILYT